LSWGRALDPFGGLSTGQLMLPAPAWKEIKEEKEEVKVMPSTVAAIFAIT